MVYEKNNQRKWKKMQRKHKNFFAQADLEKKLQTT